MASTSKKYRTITKVHLGGAEPSATLEVGEIIEINGTKLTRENGDEIKLQYPGAINSAIKIGWIVPIESDQTTFTPKPAGVEVRSATATGTQRDKIQMMSVSEEERNLGHIGSIRPDNAPDVHVAKNAGQVSRGAPTGAQVMEKRAVQRGTDDGRVVGHIKTPSNFGNVEVGKDDLRVRSKLDSNTKVEVERMGSAKATGDVQEARTGDSLEDLLPEAASAGFKDVKAQVSSAGSTVGGEEQGVEISKIGAPKIPRKPPADAEAALRGWVATGASWDDQPVSLADVRVLLKTIFRKFDVFRSAAESAVREVKSKEEVPEEEKPIVNDSSPDPLTGVWDISAHWKLRCKWARALADDVDALKAILELDPSGGVKNQVNELLEAHS